MKPSILVVMLDFLVCSLLLFVIGTGGKQTQYATSATPPRGPAIAEEFSPTAITAMQDEWNREYEQQLLLTQLNTQTAANEQLRGRLDETTTTLAQREQSIRQLDASVQGLTQEKTKVEQDRQRIEQTLSTVATQLARVNEERQQLQKEGQATKENLTRLQTEYSSLQTQQAKLQQERGELQQRAEQLGQTVTSQQATINTLSQEVRASQARVETQLGDVARDQQQMATTLAQLDEFARTLPAAMQQSVAGMQQDQQSLQDNVAGLATAVQGLQASLSAEEQAAIREAVENMTRGQQELQAQLQGLMKSGKGDQIVQSLSTIQSGQEALRQQTTSLSDQIETIKARGPGPYKAVKGARLELKVTIAKLDTMDSTIMRFRSTAFPPVVRVEDGYFIVANYQTFGFAWWALGPANFSMGSVTDLNYTVTRHGETPWSGSLTSTVCALQADPRVVTVALDQLPPGLGTLELAGPAAVLQTDQRKFNVFKTTAAGLSFEVETSPDLADPRYLVIKRALRGIAAWFENPAYRADTGDYVVTNDGKLVGVMVSRERCLILTKDSITTCTATIPLSDKQQFHRAVSQYPKIR